MSANRGLVQEVIAELFQKLKQQPLMDEEVLASLSTLADQAKLTDTASIQAALQKSSGTQNENY